MLISTTNTDTMATSSESEQSKETHSVLVRGLHEDTELEDVEDCFESLCSHGTAQVTLRQKSLTALVQFTSREDAEAVLKQGEVEYAGGVVFKVSLPEPKQKTKTVLVKGVPEDFEAEKLKFFFKNRGGPVEHVEKDANSNLFRVTFQEREDAEKVVESASLKRGKLTFIVEWLEEQEEKINLKVAISGLPDHTDREFLEDVLDSENLFEKGDQITELVKQNEIFVATFSNNIVVVKLLDTKEIEIETLKIRFNRVMDSPTENKQKDTTEPETTDTQEPFQSDQSKRRVRLTNLCRPINKQYLEVFLEKETGEKIEDIDVNDTDACATVVFHREKGVERLLEQGQTLVFSDMQIQISTDYNTRADGGKCTVGETMEEGRILQVNGIDSAISDEFLSLFFENTRKSGGGNIESLSRDESSGSVYFKFKDAKAAIRVCERSDTHTLALHGVTLEAKLLPFTKIPVSNSCAIEIQGIHEGYDDDEIIDLFEEEQYGAATVDEIYTIGDRTILTFENPLDQRRVLESHKRSPITLDGRLEISALKPSQVAVMPGKDQEPSMLLLTGYPEDCEKEDLISFIELGGCCEVTDVRYSRTTGLAVACLNEVPEKDDPWEHIRLRPLKGKMLSLQYVPTSASIEVYGAGSIPQAKIRLFFGSKQRSTGGTVDEMKAVPEEDCHIITFKEAEVAKRVVAKGNFRLERHDLTVQQHFPCLGVPNGDYKNTTVSFPNDIHFTDIEPSVLSFIRDRKRQKINGLLDNLHATVLWPDEGNKLVIQCTLTTQTENWKSLSESWEEDVTNIYAQQFKIYQRHTVNVPSDMDQNVRTFLSENLNKDDLFVRYDDFTKVVEILGEGSYAAKCSHSLQEVINSEKERLKALLERGMELVKLPVLRCQCIQHFIEDVKIRLPSNTNITVGKTAVTLEGPKSELEKAKMQLLELVSTLQELKPAWLLESSNALLQNSHLRQKMMDECLRKGVNVFVALDLKNECILCGISELMVSNASKLIGELIQTKQIPVNKESTYLIKETRFTETTDQLCKKYGLDIVIRSSEETITITGLVKSVENAVLDIQDFLDKETIGEEFITTGFAHSRLLSVSDSFTLALRDRFRVQATYKIEKGHSGINLKGTSSKINEAKSYIEFEVQRIRSDRKEITDPGMPKYFLEKAGKDQLSMVEAKEKVAIVVLEDHIEPAPNVPERRPFTEYTRRGRSPPVVKPKPSPKPSKPPQVPVPVPEKFATLSAPSSSSSGIEIVIMKQELAKSTTDAIVNTTVQSMKLGSGVVSASIHAAGGPSLEKECKKMLAKKGKEEADYGEVIESGGGNMNCKKVYHGALPGYSTSKINVLEKFILNCLCEAKRDKMKSIAFPALGTGALNYPKEIVATTMIRKIQEFDNKQNASQIKRVELVLHPKDSEIIQVFEDKLKTLTSTSFHSTSPGKKLSSSSTKKPKPSRKRSKRITFKRVCIEVMQGDITDQTTDAIAYSTDSKLQLDSQAGKAIKAKAGDDFDQQVKKTKMQNGIAITEAGDLGAKYVIHIETPSQSDEWAECVGETLLLAENKKLQSISLTAFGTGNKNTKPDIVADAMMKGIRNFCKKPPGNLKEIRIVVYQSEMVDAFTKGLDIFKKQGERRGFLSGARALFTALPPREESSSSSDVSDHSSEEVDMEIAYEKHPRPFVPHEAIPEFCSAEFKGDAKRGKSVWLQIYSLHENSNAIEQTKQAIDAICKSVCTTHVMDSRGDSEDIARLNNAKIEEIKSLGQRHDVGITICRGLQNSVELRGRNENVMHVLRTISAMFRKEEKSKEMSTFAEKVKWQFEASTGVYKDYEADENWEIEKANDANKPSIAIKSRRGDIMIDLRNMNEKREWEISSKPRMIRRYVPLAGINPPHWDKMSDHEDIKVVTLKPRDKEYREVAAHFQASLEDPKYDVKLGTIDEIQRIQNPSLLQKYLVHKNHMKNPVEQALYHGTARATIAQINANGFNRSYAGTKTAKRFGAGVYFAKYAAYSHGYTEADDRGSHTMFMCKVLTGDYTKGEEKFIDTPAKDPRRPDVKYDSVVNDMSDPIMWVIFKDDQAYPEYLIKYTQK